MLLNGEIFRCGGPTYRKCSCLLWLIVLFVGLACCQVTQGVYVSPLGDNTTETRFGDVDCRPATVSLSITSTLINLFIRALLIPELNRYNGTFIIPEQSLEHIWVGQIMVEHFHLDSIVASTGTPDAQSVVLHVKGLGLEVEQSRFTVSYLGVTCSGTFRATLSETAIDAALKLTILPEGRWNASFSKLKFDWGKFEVHHELEGGTCNFLQKIVEIFTGELNSFVALKVMAMMNEEGAEKVAQGLNEAFGNFSIRAITAPIMTPDVLAVTLDMNPVSLGCSPAPVEPTVPDLVSRDIAVLTSMTSINNLLHNAFRAKQLWMDHVLADYWNTSLFQDVFPEFYLDCPDCPLYIHVEPKKEPVLDIPNDGEARAAVEDFIVGLHVRPRSEGQTVFSSVSIEKETPAVGEHLVEAYRSLHVPRRMAAWQAGNPFVVLSLKLTSATGVRNISIVEEKAIEYEILPITVDDMKVDASRIDDVDTDKLAKILSMVWNDFMAPLANTASPFHLPFFIQRTVLEVGSELIQGGMNIGLHNEFVEAVTSVTLGQGDARRQGWLWGDAGRGLLQLL